MYALHLIILCPAAVLPRGEMHLLLIVWNIFSVYVNSRELCHYGISLFTCWPLIFLLYSSVAVLFNFKNIKCLHNILYFYVENMAGIGGKTETVFVLTHKSLEHGIDLSFRRSNRCSCESVMRMDWKWVEVVCWTCRNLARVLMLLWAPYITFRSFSHFLFKF